MRKISKAIEGISTVSLLQLTEEGNLNRILYSMAGDYLGESLEQILGQKIEDLKSQGLTYTPSNSTTQEIPVCLWSLKGNQADFLSQLLSTDDKEEPRYVIFSLTDCKAKAFRETATQEEQNKVKTIILNDQDNLNYPENFHPEYINQSGKSMALLVSDFYLAKEDINASEIQEYYTAYYKTCSAPKPLSKKPSRLPIAYAELSNSEGLCNFLSDKQNTINNKSTGVLIAKLVYPYVANVLG